MKFRHFAITVAAMVLSAGQAFAIDNVTMNSIGTVRIYVSGSSDQAKFVGGLFKQNCATGTLTTYTRPGTAATIYACTLFGGNDFTLPSGTNVLLQKYDGGGSGNGVFPVGNVGAAASPLPFIDPASCTGGASGTGTCTGTFNREPDFGVSDEEPKMFTYGLNKPSAFVSSVLNISPTTSKMTWVPSVAFIKGVAVSQKLFDALCVDQGIGAACTAGTARPSIARGALTMILSNTYAYDTQAWKPLFKSPVATSGAIPGWDSQLNICRRVNGTGTQVASNRYFNEYPTNASGALPWMAGDRSTDVVAGAVTGQIYVGAFDDSDGVKTCLNNSGAFAVGVLPFGYAEAGAGGGWKYVALNGVSPSRLAAQQGKYDFFVEGTCQYRNALTGNVATLAQKFCAGAGRPENLNAINDPDTTNGIMALPQNAACPGSAPPATTFCSSTTRGGSTFSQPFFY